MSNKESNKFLPPEKPNPKVYWLVLRVLTISIVLFCFLVIGYVLAEAGPETFNTIHQSALKYAFVIIGLIPIAYTSISSAHEVALDWLKNKFKK